jgi:geranylgeranyl diphosphate synthase type 3
MHRRIQSVVESPARAIGSHNACRWDATHRVITVPLPFHPHKSVHTNNPSVDDVEDSSLLRRGIPVAHSIFGTPQTINTANYVYFKALQDLLRMNNPKLIEIFTEELLNLHRGQGMDLYWRDSLTCPSEADYLEMVGNKTGGLFRLAIKLMQAESAVDVYVPFSLTPIPSTFPLPFKPR